MKAFLAVAAGTVFLSVLCSVLVPEGKLKKTVLFSLRMVCLLALISPVVKLFNFDSGEYSDLCDYTFLCGAYSESQEAALKSAIDERFEEDCEVEITIEYADGEFVQTAVTVATNSKNSETILQIYAYLENLNYININVI